MYRILSALSLVGLVVFAGAIFWATRPAPIPQAVILPVPSGPECRAQKAYIYDECSDQEMVFDAALARAQAEGKVLIVSYGAEWCIWCHVFHAYVTGESGKFTHHYSDSSDQQRYTATLNERGGPDSAEIATHLATYFSHTFVLVNIEGRYAPGADRVLRRTGADAHYEYSIPFVFTVTSDGRYAEHLDSDQVTIRRDTEDWFRGYDRGKLLFALIDMAAAAYGIAL
ncbi:MAG: hypothetical protein ACPGRD_12070 [Planktomarina sp.]